MLVKNCASRLPSPTPFSFPPPSRYFSKEELLLQSNRPVEVPLLALPYADGNGAARSIHAAEVTALVLNARRTTVSLTCNRSFHFKLEAITEFG